MYRDRQQILISLVFSIISVMGIGLLFSFFSQPSEPGNRFLFGLSLARFMIGTVFLLLWIVSLGASVFSFAPFTPWQAGMTDFLRRLFSSHKSLYWILTGLYGVGLICAGLLFVTLLPVAKNAEVYIGVLLRIQPLLLWLLLSLLLLLILITAVRKETIRQADFFSPLKIVLWILLFLAIYILVVMYYREAFYSLSLRRFEPPLLGLAGYLLLWAMINQYASDTRHQALISRVLFLGGIFLISFVIYDHIAAWVDWVHKGRYEYWDTLASQFLQGKLYLPEPSNPKLNHDLTLYNGKWYVPQPPLPAIVLMPLVLFIKPEDIYMSGVSAFFSAINILLVYLILEQLRNLKWIKLSQGAILWLVVLFGLGTNHLWVGVNGGVWFISQVLTVTFSAIAVLAALKGWSPWMAGLALGLAICARPNSVMTCFFVFAIAMQIMHDQGLHIDLKRIFAWSLKSGLPIMLGITGLLFYNHARFDNFLDFGYTTINGDPTIVRNAQMYGLFSPKYIMHNLEVMFLYTPYVRWDSTWLFHPDRAGMSIFLSTPALIYLVHRYQNKWWILGAWAAIFFNFALLMLYHNTGSDQFGYRYILDMILPILGLMAWTFKEKIPWHFYVLLCLGIIVNLYGAAWFMNGPG
jgi:hypothetical protein